MQGLPAFVFTGAVVELQCTARLPFNVEASGCQLLQLADGEQEGLPVEAFPPVRLSRQFGGEDSSPITRSLLRNACFPLQYGDLPAPDSQCLCYLATGNACPDDRCRARRW